MRKQAQLEKKFQRLSIVDFQKVFFFNNEMIVSEWLVVYGGFMYFAILNNFDMVFTKSYINRTGKGGDGIRLPIVYFLILNIFVIQYTFL